MIDYWGTRAIERLTKSERIANGGVREMDSLYNGALKNFQKEVASIYANYSKKGILDVSELKKAVGKAGAKEFHRKVDKKIKEMGLDPKEVFDERYLWRLNRIEMLQEQIQVEAEYLASLEQAKTSERYERVVSGSYRNLQEELRDRGVINRFSMLDDQLVNDIVDSNWIGSNFSARIWGSGQLFAKKLKQVVGSALISGQSYQKTAREIRERFGVKKWQAERLIRTETNYFHNQAELEAYKQDGIEKYEYMAVLDGRTSDVCEGLDDKIFKVSEANAGVNYPPLHPNCRSTTTAVISDLP
jgi:SPP1 gp7 family putative phage head morphogenesis protein